MEEEEKRSGETVHEQRGRVDNIPIKIAISRMERSAHFAVGSQRVLRQHRRTAHQLADRH
jgi:hypothetical protein